MSVDESVAAHSHRRSVDEQQQKNKETISKKLRDGIIRVSLKVNAKQKDPAFEFIEEKASLKENKKQMTKLKTTLDKYCTTLDHLRSLAKSIDESILKILKPDIDLDEMKFNADDRPDIPRLRDLKKIRLNPSLDRVEYVLKLMHKAEVAHVAETKAANNPEKAKEAKEETKRITEELRTRVPDVDKIVQSNITKFAKDYLIFVNEELKADDKLRKTVKSLLSTCSSETPTKKSSSTANAPSEYENNDTLADDIVPKRPALSTLARSELSTYDVPSKPSENGPANSSEKKQTLAATAATACLVDLVEDSDSESESWKKAKNKKTDKDEDEIEGASSTSEVSESQDSEYEKQAKDSENSEEDYEAEDLCSLPTPFKVVAVFSYKAQEEDELEMTQDDVINVKGGDDIQN